MVSSSIEKFKPDKSAHLQIGRKELISGSLPDQRAPLLLKFLWTTVPILGGGTIYYVKALVGYFFNHIKHRLHVYRDLCGPRVACHGQALQ